MREVVVLSGKGGTGKTSIVGAFAALAQHKILADCDVDAADLHLILKPELKEKHEFWSGQTAFIDRDVCTECGLCRDVCRFQAIDNWIVDPVSCEGCGFCYHVCPVQAITMRENLAGHWFLSETRYGPLVHARLDIAQENSGKLVAMVRKQARKVAESEEASYIISDGPPGIGCPVISSLSGTDLALLVTEPSLSGIHDLERILDVCQHFGITTMVCINKYDINEDNTRRIERYCLTQGVEVAAKIPFDNVITEAMVHGVPVVDYTDNGVTHELERLWELVETRLNRKSK